MITTVSSRISESICKHKLWDIEVTLQVMLKKILLAGLLGRSLCFASNAKLCVRRDLTDWRN